MKQTHSQSGFLTVALACIVFLVGCSPWATYPKIDGAAQIGNPQFEPFPSIMATAISAAHERAGLAGEPVFNLPAGADPGVYEAVRSRLGRIGRPMRYPDEPAVHIVEVRVRTADAEVDVIVPRRDGLPEMLTYKMRQRFLHHYRITDTRRWRIAVDFPPPHYDPPLTQRRADQAPTEEAKHDSDEP